MLELENLLLSTTIARLLFAAEEMQKNHEFVEGAEKLKLLLDFVQSEENASFLDTIFNIEHSSQIVQSVQEKTKLLMRRELSGYLRIENEINAASQAVVDKHVNKFVQTSVESLSD